MASQFQFRKNPYEIGNPCLIKSYDRISSDSIVIMFMPCKYKRQLHTNYATLLRIGSRIHSGFRSHVPPPRDGRGIGCRMPRFRRSHPAPQPPEGPVRRSSPHFHAPNSAIGSVSNAPIPHGMQGRHDTMTIPALTRTRAVEHSPI